MKTASALSVLTLLVTAAPVFASQVNSAIYQGNGKFSSPPAVVQLPNELAAIPALLIPLPKSPAPALREPHQIGYPISLSEFHAGLADLESEAAWRIIGDKKYAKITIEIPQALGLRAEAFIKTDFQGNIYWFNNPADNYKIPPRIDGSWTPISEGPQLSIIIEIDKNQGLPKNQITIPRVSIIDAHPFQENSFSSIFPDTSSCTIDLACASSSQVRAQGKSVARLNFVKNGKSYVCSGTILNDKNTTFTPYLFTANHCISSQEVANTVITTWNLEYSGCYTNNSGTPRGSSELRGGADLLHSDFNNDHTLLLLKEDPPAGTLYSGWNSNPVDSWTSIFSINHPNGDVKKVSFGSITYPPTSTVTSGENTRTGMLGMLIPTGEIQGGSSGGGVFTCTTQGCQLRGAISSGGAKNSCSSSQKVFSSRFDRAFPYIKQWLEAAPNHLQSLSFSAWPNQIQANTSLPIPETTATYSNGETRLVSPILSSSNNDILWFSENKLYTGSPSADNIVTVTANYTDQGSNYSSSTQITVKALAKPLYNNIECLFDWAERQYRSELPAAGKFRDDMPPYTCRQYPTNGAVICASNSDPYLYYKGPLSFQFWQSLGPLKIWYNSSNCNTP